MNGTRCAIRPAMKATSRDSRSSLRDRDFAFGFLRRLQRRLQLRPAVERVSALAGLDLGELGDDLEALGGGERGDGALPFEAETRTALRRGGDAIIGDERTGASSTTRPSAHWKRPGKTRPLVVLGCDVSTARIAAVNGIS